MRHYDVEARNIEVYANGNTVRCWCDDGVESVVLDLTPAGARNLAEDIRHTAVLLEQRARAHP